MKAAHFLGLALVLAPLGVIAQSGSAGGSATFSVEGMGGVDAEARPQTRTAPDLCPVTLEAKHLPDGDMVRTEAKGPDKGPGQRLHLTLTSPDARTLASATFNVRGWTAQAHMQNARNNSGSGQAVRTVQTPLTAGTGRNASADLWVPGLTAVESVELLAVSYADGSTWTPAAGNRCSVTPNPLMLVAR